MSELFLDIALIDIGRSGKPGAQGMAGEQFRGARLFGQISREYLRLRTVFLIRRATCLSDKRFPGGFTIITGDALEQRAEVYPGIVQVLLKCMHRAGLVAGAAANLNLAPAGFAAKRQDQTLFFDGDPAFAFISIVAIDIEADDFRAP